VKLRIEHRTRHWYGEPLRHAVQRLCLTPRSSAHQTVHRWTLHGSGKLYGSADGWGNLVHQCTLDAGRRTSDVHAVGEVQTHAKPWLWDEAPSAPPWVYLRHTPLSQPDAALAAFAREVAGAGAPVAPDASRLIALCAAVSDRVAYESGSTHVHTTARQAFAAGAGVCQDQAHVFIAACRSLGLPARYVSGYFHAPGAEDLASHAWADVCPDPRAGHWLSLDITHRCPIDERHVRLAIGPDYAACAPVRGVREGGGEEGMSVVLRVSEV
jgi:transglutaminase-like putative cysteine protease